MSFALHGIGVASGTALGRAVLLARTFATVACEHVAPERVEAELERLRVAHGAAVAELEHIRAQLASDAPADLAALLDVRLLLLRDEMLRDGVIAWIQGQHYNAEWALTAEMEAAAGRFDAMEDAYLRARKPDVVQVLERVLRHLAGGPASDAPAALPAHAPSAAHPCVLVAHDISPADLLRFERGALVAVVTVAGGVTSHTAIMARSMGVPAVVGAQGALDLLRVGDALVVDGGEGMVLANPPAHVRARYRRRQRVEHAAHAANAQLARTPTRTRDGVAVALEANIGNPGDVGMALAAGAEAVGLFRSEFLFMRGDAPPPREEAQYRVYRRTVQAMDGRPVTIRSADLGGDKPAAGEGLASVRGSPLGLRGVRLSLAQPEGFLEQLRAILRAAAEGPVRLLIPMVGCVAQMRQVQALVARAREQLAERHVAAGPLPLGAMIEIPAAAIAVRRFLRVCDFVSLGTNDLVQYTLAVDRTDEAVAPLFDPWHPAVLRLLADVIAAGAEADKDVTICGEIAGDPLWTPLLLGLGLRHFSMQSARLLDVKRQVLDADLPVLAAWAAQVLASDDPESLARAHAERLQRADVPRCAA